VHVPESEALQQAAAAFIRDRQRLGAFVGGLLRDAHAAEDVIQEVWLRLAAEVENGTVFAVFQLWSRASFAALAIGEVAA
jgi:DNA-directed RNA polymerase specialized sigma24 family protein